MKDTPQSTEIPRGHDPLEKYTTEQAHDRIGREAFHVVLTTHNSRVSERMKTKNVFKSPALHLQLYHEIKLAEILSQIIRENQYKCLACNFCKDHVHLIIVCRSEELVKIIQKVKSVSSRLFRKWLFSIDRDKSESFISLEGTGSQEPLELDPSQHTHLWSQKFYDVDLDVWTIHNVSTIQGMLYKSTHLENAINYIVHNRQKHNLKPSEKLQDLINSFIISEEEAFL